MKTLSTIMSILVVLALASFNSAAAERTDTQQKAAGGQMELVSHTALSALASNLVHGFKTSYKETNSSHMSVSVAEHDSILVGVRSMTTEAALTITENGLSIKDAAAARKQNWNQNSALQAPQSIRIGWAYPNDVPEPIVLFIAADSEYRWQAFARFCKSDKGQEILRKTDRMFQSLPQDKRT